jgi:hypothetical protein
MLPYSARDSGEAHDDMELGDGLTPGACCPTLASAPVTALRLLNQALLGDSARAMCVWLASGLSPRLRRLVWEAGAQIMGLVRPHRPGPRFYAASWSCASDGC